MSPAIEAFVNDARRYCEWVESKDHDPLTARQLLLVLMAGIPALVPSKAEQESDQEYPSRSYDEWKATHAGFADLPFQYYQEMFAPLDLSDKEPVTGNLCDDLADIYGELWHGLEALKQGDGHYAVEHWRDSYMYHWGEHASSALRAIDEHFRITHSPYK